MRVVGYPGCVVGLLVVMLGCGGEVQPLGDVAGSSGSSGGGASGAQGSGGKAGSPSPDAGAGAASVHPCETTCLNDVLRKDVPDCKLCHAKPGLLQSSGLDLESPGLTARLKDVPAKHLDLAPPQGSASCPVGDKLIDTQAPEQSWLLKKIKGQQGSCGTAMPQTPPLLRVDEIACVERYVYCVAGQAPPGN